MNRMLGIGITAVVIAMVAYVAIQAQIAEAPTDTTPAVSTDTTDTSSTPTELAVTRSFTKGTHTIRGLVTTPTPCHELSANVVVSSTSPATATLVLDVRESGEEMCIHVLDEKEFDVSFEGDASMDVTATLNGQPVTLTTVNPS